MLAAVAAVLVGACGDGSEPSQQPADATAVSVPPLPGSPTVAPELLEVPALDPDSVAAITVVVCLTHERPHARPPTLRPDVRGKVYTIALQYRDPGLMVINFTA